MKKVLLCMFLLYAGLMQAQERVDLDKIHELTFLGVDFSLAKVYGADESADQFKVAFTGINNLLVTEAKKYDVPKAFPRKNVTIYLTPSLNLIQEMDVTELFTDSNNYRLSEEEIDTHIRELNTGDAKGYGAILIAGLLDKASAKATYHLVVFDIATREVISNRIFTEKAKGFGLRNYWARTVYSTLKEARKK